MGTNTQGLREVTGCPFILERLPNQQTNIPEKNTAGLYIKGFQGMDEERFISRMICYTVVNSNFSFVNKGNRTGAKYFSGYK